RRRRWMGHHRPSPTPSLASSSARRNGESENRNLGAPKPVLVFGDGGNARKTTKEEGEQVTVAPLWCHLRRRHRQGRRRDEKVSCDAKQRTMWSTEPQVASPTMGFL
ncbi:hypothetical protein U1Q18_043059, partial [Sarracenia purpurea var. burkii]